MTNTSTNPRRLLRSAGALLLGFIVVAALSLGTDQLMHLLGLFPPLGHPVQGSGFLFLAFIYRSIYVIFGSYLVARFSPYAPNATCFAFRSYRACTKHRWRNHPMASRLTLVSNFNHANFLALCLARWCSASQMAWSKR